MTPDNGHDQVASRNTDPGLLIVNADDWGYEVEVTEAIERCFLAGGLTSTTAMVFMDGSADGAERARELPRLGIGLHLNFYEPYTAEDVPEDVRRRQAELVGYYRRSGRRRWIYDPTVSGRTARIIEDQLRRFAELYGRPPTHVDGHHHSHLAANVLLSRALPAGTKIRNALTDVERMGALNRTLRKLRYRLFTRRLRTTDYFFSVLSVWPDLAGPVQRERLELARSASVEIMVHPGFPHELLPLQSETWVNALHEFRTGTFADLPA